jgi:hypothetical protein
MAGRPEHGGYTAAHELSVARALVAALRAAGEDLDDPRPRGAPDAVVSSPRGPIGIDVADAGAPEPPEPGAPAPPGLPEGGTDAALTQHLEATLRDHCRRSYGLPTYLVIDVRGGPLTDGADAQAVASALTIPAGCRFARVFVRLRPQDGGDPALYELRGAPRDGPSDERRSPASAGTPRDYRAAPVPRS